MQLTNYTPFPLLVFESEDVQRRASTVVVVRGTFAIDEGRALRPIPEQDPVVRADRFRGELNRSSLLVESDLAPYKPRSDIHVEAVAYPPDGDAQPSWLVRLRVGAIDKRLRVTGPRAFRKTGRRWVLTEPEPCREVALVYEHAFGGRRQFGELELVDEHNPVGVGWWPADAPKDARVPDELAAPRIESPTNPVRTFGELYPPEGVGPMTRAWLPRRALAGTFDDAWHRERWPALPLDFDFAHYNSAHPDLIYPGYLLGDEPIELEGLSASGPMRFSLPGFRVMVCLDGPGERAGDYRCELDTVRLDLPAGRASLTWRARAYRAAMPERLIAYLETIAQPAQGSTENHG